MIPKFRAWDSHEKKMFTNAQLIIWNGNVYANDNSKLSVDNLKGWNVDEKYLMQSTGLLDVNGKEIFEGDVVDVFDSRYTVFYDSENASFRLKPRDKRWNTDYMSNYAHEASFEIIGNIYENPELLEEVE